MNPLLSTVREPLAALALLMLLLAVLTGVSMSQASLLDRQADQLEDVTLPALRRVHEVRRLVDEARGLEAMHLLVATDTERERIEARLARQRQLVQGRLPTEARGAADAQELKLREAVQQRLAAYWAQQDRVIAASRQAVADPLRRPEASALMAGDSQAAWTQLGEALGAWLQHQERRAADLAQASRSQAQWLRLGMAAVASVLLFGAIAWRLRLRQLRRGVMPSSVPLPPGSSFVDEPEGLPEALEAIATQSRLLALNASVQAARRGEATPADLAERAHLAAEARLLADRCEEARRDCRLGQPRQMAGAS